MYSGPCRIATEIVAFRQQNGKVFSFLFSKACTSSTDEQITEELSIPAKYPDQGIEFN